ncbi:MAG TPA: hypothetical protein VMC10_06365 [Stellaceae bacterium]|nr:hypothetical protein [Stellaceae bacterium]
MKLGVTTSVGLNAALGRGVSAGPDAGERLPEFSAVMTKLMLTFCTG